MNEKKINMIGTIIKVLFIAIGVIVSAMVITGPNADSAVNSPEVIEKFRDGGAMSAAIGFSGFLIITCTALVVLFFVLLHSRFYNNYPHDYIMKCSFDVFCFQKSYQINDWYSCFHNSLFCVKWNRFK